MISHESIILIKTFLLCLSYFMTTLYQCLMFACLLQYFFQSISLAFYFFLKTAKCKAVYFK